jgi:phosphoserine phosphatase
MSFLVLSPGLAPEHKPAALAQDILRQFDRLLPMADRRLRQHPKAMPHVHAAVYQMSPERSTGLTDQLRLHVRQLAQQHQIDHAWLQKPYRWKDFSVLAMDMDSTVITIECIDELADFCGKKDQVAAITEAAMRGELKDYAESLRQRVALLAGLPQAALQEVIRHRLKFTPGVKALVETAHRHGLHTLLVSGGFVQFTDFVSEKIGFAETRSNTLEIKNGPLTGRLIGKIVDATVKAATVSAACRRLGVSRKRAITVGDGANDLKMMQASGLSIAHRAKPAVAAQATQTVAYGGLDNILDWFE